MKDGVYTSKYIQTGIGGKFQSVDTRRKKDEKETYWCNVSNIFYLKGEGLKDV